LEFHPLRSRKYSRRYYGIIDQKSFFGWTALKWRRPRNANTERGTLSGARERAAAVPFDCHHVPKAPVPALRDQHPTWANTAALAKKWQLNQLA
jgi:hypothetical protein